MTARPVRAMPSRSEQEVRRRSLCGTDTVPVVPPDEKTLQEMVSKCIALIMDSTDETALALNRASFDAAQASLEAAIRERLLDRELAAHKEWNDALSRHSHRLTIATWALVAFTAALVIVTLGGMLWWSS